MHAAGRLQASIALEDLRGSVPSGFHDSISSDGLWLFFRYYYFDRGRRYPLTAAHIPQNPSSYCPCCCATLTPPYLPPSGPLGLPQPAPYPAPWASHPTSTGMDWAQKPYLRDPPLLSRIIPYVVVPSSYIHGPYTALYAVQHEFKGGC